MSKIRVYELAKELGVDNKIVVAKALELGFSAVKSHSSSLDTDEADQIRRALIRQAMGTPGGGEVVHKRVDKVTGATDTIVEKRRGDVIRRRKQAEDDKPIEEEHQVEPVFAQGIQDHSSTSPEEAGGVQIVSTEQEQATSHEEHLSNGAALKASRAAIQEDSEQEDVEEKQVETTSDTTQEDGKKTVGPKVLGKIELPGKRPTPPKAESKKQVFQGGGSAAPKIVAVEEEEEEETRSKAKKTKRREISRVDLLDYEGREVRRLPKGGGKGKHKDKIIEAPVSPDAVKMKASKRVVRMSESITVGELAKQMSVKAGDVIAKLMGLGVMATINQSLDKDIATIVAEEFEFTLESTTVDESTILTPEIEDEVGEALPRPPVVTVMGHVDHGKTSLLDAIREATVAEREHGGITQHIGAYRVDINGKSITFIDTPGHAAFTSMRARGAEVTDIVILVVAADDGVMPQTIEALNHAKAAGVPIVVAVNKMDKQNVNPDRVKQQLSEQGLHPEEWGGDTMYIPVSALKKTGLDNLLEAVLLQAEVKELKANPNKKAKGAIIEARQDKGRGVVATILVQSGTLRVGDIFVSGDEYGRIRSMHDEKGEKLNEAPPSCPVEITGFQGVPSSGDDFFVVESEAQARQVSEVRKERTAAEERALASGPISLEEFSRRAGNQQAAELNVIVKADVHGSVEAVKDSVEKLTTDKVKVRVLHAAVGGITESDIQLAVAAKAIIVGFNVRAEPRATLEAEKQGVELRFYRIIYELIDDVRNAMVGLLEPIKQESLLGRVEVRQIFNAPKVGTIAGSYVKDGLVKRNALVRLLRDSKVIHEGKLGSLKRFKDDVREVQSGYECGLNIEGFNDVKPGDEIEVYEYKEIAPTLE